MIQVKFWMTIGDALHVENICQMSNLGLQGWERTFRQTNCMVLKTKMLQWLHQRKLENNVSFRKFPESIDMIDS